MIVQNFKILLRISYGLELRIIMSRIILLVKVKDVVEVGPKRLLGWRIG